MKIIWALETDRSRFKFSLCHLLAMWLWISQLMYLNLITDLRSFAVKIKWGNANKAHRIVPDIQEAPNVIFYEFPTFLISWNSWLDFFPPWSPPWFSFLVNIVNIQEKGQEFSVIQRPLCSPCFLKSRLELLKFWVSNLRPRALTQNPTSRTHLSSMSGVCTM